MRHIVLGLRQLIAETELLAVPKFNISRFTYLMAHSNQFGVMSAYRANLDIAQNKQRQKKLLQDLERLGYGSVVFFKASWPDYATGTVNSEQSVLIDDITFGKLLDLGKKYAQDAIVYKDPSGTIGIYNYRNQAQMAFDPKGGSGVSVSKGKDEYSKGRTMSFGLQLMERLLPYNGKPITKQQLESILKNDQAQETSQADV